MKLKDNQLKALFLLAISIFAYTTWSMQTRDGAAFTNQDFIRFHVIANSNEAQDQELKGLVRDELLSMITSELAEYAVSTAGTGAETASLDMETSRAYIQERIPQIEQEAEAIIAREGYDYSVTAALGARWVPEKTYGGIVLPEGNYEALNIVIGEGSGENWWCVLFPPLCLIGEQTPEEMDAEVLSAMNATAEHEAIFRQALETEKYDGLLRQAQNDSGEPVKIEVKFKVLEMLSID